MSDVIIKISDEEYTIEEARELYLELGQLFKANEWPPYTPYPISPTIPRPYFVTSAEAIK